MSNELATVEPEVEHRPPMTLFGTNNPEAVVEQASSVATSLAKVIDERSLTANIAGKKHVQVEGWTLLGSMLGVFAEVEWTRPLENGWEARAVARTLNGNVVGAAEAMCTTSEYRWRRADDYAVRSMAQTRAVSKALRMPLGFIMHLAGYSATPAEELVDEQPEPSARGGSPGGPSSPSVAHRSAPAPDLRDQLLQAVKDHGMGADAFERLAVQVGVKEGQKASDDQLRKMIALIEAPASSEAPATPEPAVPSVAPGPSLEEVLEVTGGELIPPKPNTPEYGALKPQEKASARAYWATHKDEEPTLAEQLQVPA